MSDNYQLQRTLLRLLGDPRTDRRLGGGRHYLSEALASACATTPSSSQVQQAFWSLVSQGLAYINMTQPAPENWSLELTDAGRAAVSDREVNPDDPTGYFDWIGKNVPGLSAVAGSYLREAVAAFNHTLYFASAVMLGVAAEAVFLETASAFAPTLGGRDRDDFQKLIANPKRGYLEKYNEFRKKSGPIAQRLPSELRENLDLVLGGVQELLRIYRNDAAHPTGRPMAREECFANLRVAAEFFKRMYEMKTHFEKHGPAAP